MRAIAGWLLLVSTGLLFADTFTAARMATDCCCAGMPGMAKSACPLREHGQTACDDRGRGHCALTQSDANTGAKNRVSTDSRDPSVLTETASPQRAPSAAPSSELVYDAYYNSQDPLPDTPPPRGV
jgi:hypothetical protein